MPNTYSHVLKTPFFVLKNTIVFLFEKPINTIGIICKRVVNQVKIKLLRFIFQARGGELSMARLFNVKLSTSATREVMVVAETPEEAQAKVQPQEGEAVVEVSDQGEVVA